MPTAAHRAELTTYLKKGGCSTCGRTPEPGAGNLIPPIYLGADWIGTARPGRPFADALPTYPYPEAGKTVSIPRVATGPEADVQAAENDAVKETDFDDEMYSVSKVTIAGQNDVSIQALDWSQPGLDTVILRELTRDYDKRLDYQLIYGTGSNGQHRGLKTVVVSDAGNAVALASGGADELLAKIYEACSDIATNAPGFAANAVLIHPRRAAWMASHRDALHPLLQQGGLNLASG